VEYPSAPIGGSPWSADCTTGRPAGPQEHTDVVAGCYSDVQARTAARVLHSPCPDCPDRVLRAPKCGAMSGCITMMCSQLGPHGCRKQYCLGAGRMRIECFRDSAPGLSKGCCTVGVEVWAVLASLESRHAACKVVESAHPMHDASTIEHQTYLASMSWRLSNRKLYLLMPTLQKQA
jgi:hypothetical protein